MSNEIDSIINEIQPNWSKDKIIRFLYIKLAPFFRRDLKYFLATDEEKYEQFSKGFINRGYDIVCSTISDYYVNLFNEFGIKAKKIAANSARIPLFAVIVKGDHSWYYIDPLNDLFHNQYGLQTTEYGIIPHYKTLERNYPYLEILPKEYITSIDQELHLPPTLDDAFRQLHLEMTERNQIFDTFSLEKGDYINLFEKKISFINKHLLNIGNVKGPYERIILYLYLERMLFFKKEKRDIVIKLVQDQDSFHPIFEYHNPQDNSTITYHEQRKNNQYILKK